MVIIYNSKTIDQKRKTWISKFKNIYFLSECQAEVVVTGKLLTETHTMVHHVDIYIKIYIFI